MIKFSPKRASYTKGKLSLQFIVATILSWVRDFITAPECPDHGLRTPSEEIAFTARPKIQSKIPNFLVQPKHILSAKSALFFRYF